MFAGTKICIISGILLISVFISHATSIASHAYLPFVENDDDGGDDTNVILLNSGKYWASVWRPYGMCNVYLQFHMKDDSISTYKE